MNDFKTSTALAPGVDLRFVADLAIKSSDAQMLEIATGDLSDAGLPREIPVIWDPAGKQLVSLKTEMERYRLWPREKSGTAQALTLAAFCDLMNRHKIADSAVFANTDWRSPTFTGVVDYHPVQSADGSYPAAASNCKHRIHYAFPLSEEWKAWVEMDGQVMSQIDFATFLEDRIVELSSPTAAEKLALERDHATTVATPADVVQLSRGLQVNVNSVVKATHTLQNGTGQIQWTEDHVGADGKPLVVPGMFLLAIAPFFMGEKARIPVRLRYKASGGSVKWLYQIYRPDVHVTERVRTDLDIVAAKTELPVYEAKPEVAG